MSEQNKNDESIRNWVTNAEEHGRMAAQLATLVAKLQALTKIADNLEGGQKELQEQLVSEIRFTKNEIKETNARIDKFREYMTSEIKETNERNDKLRDDMTSEFKETNARIDKLREDMTSEFKETNKRIDNLRDDMTSEFKETNKRIDNLRDDMTSEIKEVFARLAKQNEEANARTAEKAEADRKELRNELRWFMGIVIAALALLTAVLAL